MTTTTIFSVKNFTSFLLMVLMIEILTLFFFFSPSVIEGNSTEDVTKASEKIKVVLAEVCYHFILFQKGKRFTDSKSPNCVIGCNLQLRVIQFLRSFSWIIFKLCDIFLKFHPVSKILFCSTFAQYRSLFFFY